MSCAGRGPCGFSLVRPADQRGSLRRRPPRIMHGRFFPPGPCTAIRATDHSWPDRGCHAPAAPMGFFPSQLCSGLRVSGRCRSLVPHMSFASSSPRSIFFGGLAGFESIDKTHTDLDQSRSMMRGSWDLPPLASRASPPRLRTASRCCPGISLLQVFQTPIGAFERARPRTDHQPPATVSGPYPLMGFTHEPLGSRGSTPMDLAAVPAPTLQRIKRLMPGRSSMVRAPGPAPCLRFRTV